MPTPTRRAVPAALGLLALSLTACVAAGAPPATEPSGPPLRAEQFRFTMGGGDIGVDVAAGPARVSNADVHTWVRTAATAVSRYYGRFPVKVVDVTLSADGNGKLDEGVQYDGRYIRLDVGAGTTPQDLHDDWVMTHEMFHLAFPFLGDPHRWMNEGLSTYLEPVARARIGNMTETELWKETVEGMPKGQPAEGDQGLDRTATWGRTYWGGAMFWLLADVTVREKTHNRKSLDDAVRAVLAAGGDGSVTWKVEKVISVGDAATGTTVLADLYAQLGTHPVKTDLNALWAKLGVVYAGGKVTFDDTAPLAAVRKAMTSPDSDLPVDKPAAAP